MKEINEYIESNTRLYEEAKKEYEETQDESEKLRIKLNIEAYKYYVIGLRDAKNFILADIKKYIESEKK